MLNPHISPPLWNLEVYTPGRRSFYFLLLGTEQICETAGIYCLAQGHYQLSGGGEDRLAHFPDLDHKWRAHLLGLREQLEGFGEAVNFVSGS